MSKLATGQIRTSDLGRHFQLTTGGGRSLKEVFLRRNVSETREFWALRHVSVDIEPGETFGIVGRNGSGKSTFLKLLARIYGPSEGTSEVGGRMSSLIELGAGFHPEFNAIENVFLAGAVYGIPKSELERDMSSILEFAELENFAYQPIKTYSSGMFMRLGFSVAMHVRPDVLLLDEVLAVGDERFVQKCLARVGEFRRAGGTMLLVTHDPDTVKRVCDRAMLLEKGHVLTVGTADDVLKAYHERLSSQADGDGSSQDEPELKMSRRFDAAVTILNAQGRKHHQFVEAESLSIRVRLVSRTTTSDATISVRIRDEAGREVGTQMLRGISFGIDEERFATLALSSPPFRNGLFHVDLSVTDSMSGLSLLDMEVAETFTVYGQTADCHGAIQMGGSWLVE
jgi:ABC-type polysaccharide/polyol phosphate transport system ATPase subunit